MGHGLTRGFSIFLAPPGEPQPAEEPDTENVPPPSQAATGGLATPEKQHPLRSSLASNRLALASPANVPSGVRRVTLAAPTAFEAGALSSDEALKAEPETTTAAASDATAREAMLQEDFIPGLTYEYFAGAFEELPNFDELKPSQSGVTPLCSLQTLIESGVIPTEPRSGPCLVGEKDGGGADGEAGEGGKRKCIGKNERREGAPNPPCLLPPSEQDLSSMPTLPCG